MAINWLESGALFSSSPSWYKNVGYEEIGRDATTVTIRVHLQLKLKGSGSSTFYGYPAYWSVNDGSSMQIKTSSRWYGGQDYRGFYTDIRVGANAGGGSGTFKIHMWSTSGGNAGFTQNFTFNYSKWNTKPYWIGGNKITLRENNAGGRVISSEPWGTENAYKFPENVGAIYIDWGGQARDNENNPLTYELWMQSNDGGWSVIYTGGATSYTHYIGAGAGTQGRSYDYYVKVRDSYGEWADGECNATQVQKNQLSQAMLNHSGSVNFDSTSISLSRTNASNSNGNGSFTYNLSSQDITVYNGNNITNTSIPVTIYRSGAIPSTPYVKWEDLKNFLRGSNYNRNIRFNLTSTNAYGSTASDYEDVWCDIRKNPSNFSFGSVSGATVVNGKSYFLPSEKEFTMTWGASTDPLGTQVTYDLYYAYDNVSWNLIASNLTKNTHTAKLPNVGKLTILTFRVVAKTAYGTSVATEGGRTELHYVGVPNVNMDLTRNQSNYVIKGNITVNSSIPNLTLSHVRYRDNDSARFDEATISGLTFNITRNLGETEAQELVVYVLDRGNSDLGRQPTEQKISISRYMPMFSIREKGVGVNAIPDGSAKLIVNGGIKVDGVGSNSVRNFGKRMITVNGDKNTYYPVLLRGTVGFATNKISISRGFSWKAPDTWNTATHRGGLTFTFTWAGDGTWGGNSREYTVTEFSETYTTMVAGMRNTTGGFVVWLRGGGAEYQIDSDYGRVISADIYLGTYTAPDKATYAPRTNTNEVRNEIHPFYCVRSNHLYDEGRRVLTEGQLTSYDNIRGKIPQISGDGVMEVGKYIDFHNGNGGDFDGRLTLQDDNALNYNHWFIAPSIKGGNLILTGSDFKMNDKRALVGWAGANDPLIINYNGDFKGGIQLEGYTKATGQLDCDSLPGVWGSQLRILTHKDGNGNGDGNTHIGYNGGNGYSHYFRGTGSFNVDCHGGINTWQIASRYYKSPDGQNLDLEAKSGTMYFNVFSQSDCGLIIDRAWGGTQGSEVCLHTNKGNGWGFLGNSGNAFYRIYGTGGSVSDRKRKYDIHKFDNQYLYDQVKELTTYAYRTISDETDEEGNVVNQLYRSDMQIGCMIDELPIETVIYDDEGGNGKAVDIYAYCTMILGTVKVIQNKLETMESKIEHLEEVENQVEVLGNQVKTLTKEKEEMKNRLEKIERMLKENGIS